MKKLDIIFENQDLLVINKPSKMLTISDGKSLNNLYSYVREYVKKKHKSNKIFIVHRLDKDTSGVVVFAKNIKTKNYLQNNWNNIVVRKYLAILEGKLPSKKGKITEYLMEDKKTHHVYASKNGALAITQYQVLKYTLNNTIVDIKILTGKKNQIRVGFSNLGYPIIGDKTYRSTTNPINRLGLHAYRLELQLDKLYIFEAKIPNEFQKYLNNM